MYKIPRRINISGTKYTVKRIDTRKLKDWGSADVEKRILEVTKRDRKISDDSIFRVFLHEYWHAALHEQGYEKLWGNEKLVEDLAKLTEELLWQIKKTRTNENG